MPSSNGQPSTSLHLLAPNGIVRVTFSRSLNSDECIALLNATQTATNANELEQSFKELGDAWGIPTVTEIVSRKRVEASSYGASGSPPLQYGS